MLLCSGGGRTPWNTWVSCEEVEFDGQIYQVDPFGERKAEVMTLGSDGGRWESFAYDVRNKEEPHFFATEDHNKGTVRRFTPKEPDWDNDPWMMLHGEGTVDYLMISPNVTNNGGTFIWTDDEEAAKNNARSFYPQTEGIDVHSNEMFFVCKNMRQIFVLDLDHGTYWNATTVNGMFDGKSWKWLNECRSSIPLCRLYSMFLILMSFEHRQTGSNDSYPRRCQRDPILH